MPLYGSAAAPSYREAQAIAVVDLSGSAGCAPPPCGTVVNRLSLEDPASPGACLSGTCDAPGFPFPSRAVALESPSGRVRILVTLANLKPGAFGYYTDPAGNGRLLVIDAAAGDALSAVDLGPDCLNPGGIAELGTTVWVACGGSGTLVPVDASVESPLVGTAVALPAFFAQRHQLLRSGPGYRRGRCRGLRRSLRWGRYRGGCRRQRLQAGCGRRHPSRHLSEVLHQRQ